MPKPYIVRKGDSMAKIAEATLGDRKHARALADYNGLADVKDIAPGQALTIPRKSELVPPKKRAAGPGSGARAGVAPWPPAPHGLEGIVATFGDIRTFARDDGTANPAWEQFMARAALPFAIPLSWAPATTASGIRCHKLIVPLIEAVFTDIVNQGLKSAVKTYGGAYNWRMKRGQSKPSTHSWGIALDLNVRSNQMGTAGDMDPRLVALFKSYGFVWGGDWPGANKDPMHFQYCSGY